jgi:hypothetical protein
MSPAEIAGFLAQGDLAIVAVPTADGGLALRVSHYRADGGALLLADAVPAGSGACALVDTYPEYNRIKGAILRGRVTDAGGRSRFESERATGFDFAKMANP